MIYTQNTVAFVERPGGCEEKALAMATGILEKT